MTGVCVIPTHWGFGWTAGYLPWERIFWIGPLGLMFRRTFKVVNLDWR